MCEFALLTHLLYNCSMNLKPFLYLFVLLLFACRNASVEFTLTQTANTISHDVYTIEVDNCNGHFSRNITHRYRKSGSVVIAKNLIANGGEPFQSVRKQIQAMYGKAGETVQLSTPAKTMRVFTIQATQIYFEGTVNGEVIERNKINPDLPVIYVYPFNEETAVINYQDIPCTTAQ